MTSPMRVRLSVPLLAACLAVVGCDRAPEPDAVAPAPAATAARPAPAATTAAPAPALAPDAIAYFGFRSAPFGSDEKMLRAAWDGPLTTEGPPQADACYYLYPAGQVQAPGRQGLGFMFERGHFVRIDVDDPALIAPGGGRIGMRRQEIAALYPQRLTVQPHKYVDGAQYLRVPDAGNSGQVLLFETDAEGRVARWRIGMVPQVDYVEGCS